MAKDKNKYGQYMTPEIIANFMVSIADLNKTSKILEPCSGQGVFLDALKKQGYKDITAYEIDSSIVKPEDNVKIASFVSAPIKENYDLIIGNPPYIRWKNLEAELKNELAENHLWNSYCNSLCDYSCVFMIKSIELLKENGQLIFITPEYWLNTTHSLMMRNYMLENGYFEKIFHFNETPIFEDASVSTIIFKYVKSKSKKPKNIDVVKYFLNRKLNENILENIKIKNNQDNCEHITIPQFEKDKRWLLASTETINELNIFEEHCKKEKGSNEFYTVKDICDIGNGLVSGLDKAFQVENIALNKEEEKQTIKVMKGKNLSPFYHGSTTKYIFTENIKDEKELKAKLPNFYKHLQEYKDDLEKRYQYNRHINYWEWVFLRNLKLFSKDTQKIFVPCKERISNKDYFRFSLVDSGIYPTQDVTAIVKKDSVKESIYYILALLNHKMVFDWLKYNGIVKGNIVEFSEKPIASIPFRRIDFSKKEEIDKHDKITQLTKEYIKTKKDSDRDKINIEISKLFNN